MISYLANPHRFLKFERYASIIFGAITLIVFPIALWWSLIQSPPDYQHGDSVRIMYVHVPAAWCALLAYTALTIASFISFVWRHNLADIAARSFALPGLAFTFLALATGSIWGQTAWGTWWAWDARLTSVLILFFIYIAYLSIWHLVDNRKHASRLASILAMIGFVNIPIIKFSVDWWNSLHQPASLSSFDSPGMASEFLFPLILMSLAYSFFFGWVSLKSIKYDVLKTQALRNRTPSPATVKIEDI